MTDVGDARFRAVSDFGALFSDLNKLEGRMSSVQQGIAAAGTDMGQKFQSAGGLISSVGSGIQSVGGTLTKFLTVPLAGLTGVVGGLAAKGGIGRLMGLENADRLMTQMGLSTDQTSGLMDSLLDTLLGTPFALNEGATALANLVSAGADLDRIPGLMNQITDAAAFGNQPLDEMAQIWQRIQLNGRVSNRELQMLTQRNIPVYQLLGEVLGKTAEEVRDMAADGAISADIFFDAWDEGAKGFGENGIVIEGVAKSMGDTTQGAFANMRTAMSRFGATLLKEIFPVAKPLFESIGKGFDDMGKKLGPLMDQFARSDAFQTFVSNIDRIPEFMGRAVDVLIEAGRIVRDVVVPAIRSAWQMFQNLSDRTKAMLPIFAVLGAVLGPVLIVVGKLVSGVGGLVSGFGAMATRFPMIGGAFKLLLGPLGLILGLFGLAVARSPELQGVLLDLLSAFGELAIAIGTALIPVIEGLITALVPVLIAIVETMIPIITAFADWIAQNEGLVQVIGTVVGLVLGLFIGLKTLLTIFGVLKSGVGLAALAVKGLGLAFSFLLAHPVVAAIAAIIAIVALLIANWDKVGPFFEMVWEWIVDAFNTAVEWIGNLIDTVFNAIVGWISDTWSALTGFFSELWETIKGLISAAVEFLKQLFLNFTPLGLIIKNWETLTGFFSGLWESIKSTISGAIENIKGVLLSVKATIDSVVGFFRNLWGRLRGAFDRVVSGIRDKVQKAKDALSKLNPFARGSPSLVEYVEMGVAKIGATYEKLGDLDIRGPRLFTSVEGESLPPSVFSATTSTGDEVGGMAVVLVGIDAAVLPIPVTVEGTVDTGLGGAAGSTLDDVVSSTRASGGAISAGVSGVANQVAEMKQQVTTQQMASDLQAAMDAQQQKTAVGEVKEEVKLLPDHLVGEMDRIGTRIVQAVDPKSFEGANDPPGGGKVSVVDAADRKFIGGDSYTVVNPSQRETEDSLRQIATRRTYLGADGGGETKLSGGTGGGGGVRVI